MQKKAFLLISHKSAQNHTKSPHPAPHKACRFYQAARTPPRIDHYPTQEPCTSDTSHQCPTETVPYVAPRHEILCRERRAKAASSVDLSKAKRVVGVGRGLAAQDDLKMVHELAAVLNAEVGCSRPIAEGENWMERERYIGVSGVLLKSDLYLTLGISGQIQHMVGGNGAKVIVAINKDKNAPIFNYADYGLVGDIYKVVPALISQLSR